MIIRRWIYVQVCNVEKTEMSKLNVQQAHEYGNSGEFLYSSVSKAHDKVGP